MPTEQNFANQHVVITGGSSGIARLDHLVTAAAGTVRGNVVDVDGGQR